MKMNTPYWVIKLYSKLDYFLILFSFLLSYAAIWIAAIIVLWWIESYLWEFSYYGISFLIDLMGSICIDSIYFLPLFIWGYTTYVFCRYEYLKIDKNNIIEVWEWEYDWFSKIPVYIYLYNSRFSWFAIASREIFDIELISWMDFSSTRRAHTAVQWIIGMLLMWLLLITFGVIICIPFIVGLGIKQIYNFSMWWDHQGRI